jgi:hypothetical protein
MSMTLREKGPSVETTTTRLDHYERWKFRIDRVELCAAVDDGEPWPN